MKLDLQLPRFLDRTREFLYVFGASENAVALAAQASDAVLCPTAPLSNELRADMREKRVRRALLAPAHLIALAITRAKAKKGRHTLIIDSGTEAENIRLAELVLSHIRDMKDGERDGLFRHLTVRVAVENTAAYAAMWEKSAGCMRGFSIAATIAEEFVFRYPLARFLDARHINYEKGLLRERTDIRVFFLGFDGVGSALFSASAATNCFLAEKGEGNCVRPVFYYVFDAEAEEKRRALDATYFRYRNFRPTANAADYLPLPEPASDAEFFSLDPRAPRTLGSVAGYLLSGEQDANFAVISCGSDAENIAIARALCARHAEFGGNLTVFLHLTAPYDLPDLVREGCIPFGYEASVYTADAICGGAFERMAMRRNEAYSLEYALTQLRAAPSEANLRENRLRAEESWYLSTTEENRLSSRYGCLSLRSKLNLIGLDICREDEASGAPAITEEEYLAIYAAGDAPAVRGKVGGRSILSYPIEFPASLRRTMAEHEHLRWNAFVLTRGYLPATRTDILDATARRGGKEVHTNGKDPHTRRHGNLTDFEGLYEFRRLIAARDQVGEEQTDVIKYDYQLMDDAFWLLRESGFRIIKLQH